MLRNCVFQTHRVKFIVHDRNGDGMSPWTNVLRPPGAFSVMLNGTEVARGDGNFEFYDVKSIGHCECLEGEVFDT
eukprot:scaffold10510_cov84-Skeletonema_dohrnii-CCMP3373.AAC.7